MALVLQDHCYHPSARWRRLQFVSSQRTCRSRLDAPQDLVKSNVAFVVVGNLFSLPNSAFFFVENHMNVVSCFALAATLDLIIHPNASLSNFFGTPLTVCQRGGSIGVCTRHLVYMYNRRFCDLSTRSWLKIPQLGHHSHDAPPVTNVTILSLWIEWAWLANSV